MPISAIGMMRAEAGFGLIELMIVVAIIATLSLAAVMSLRVPQAHNPQNQARAFSQAIAFLRDEARYRARDLAVSIEPGGWRSLEFDPENQSWRARGENRLHAHGDWSGQGHVRLELDGRPVLLTSDAAPEIFVLSSGGMSAFRLIFGNHVMCDSDTIDLICAPAGVR